jgi:hypothetical protein
MSLKDRIHDRTRPKETVWDRMRPYIQPYLKSTPRVSPTVPRSYINRMKSFETVPKSYTQHPIIIRMSHDHGTIQSSAQTVSYERHTTNTVQVRIMHDIHGMVRVFTVSHGSYTVKHGLYIIMNCTTKTTTSFFHPRLLYLPGVLATSY